MSSGLTLSTRSFLPRSTTYRSLSGRSSYICTLYSMAYCRDHEVRGKNSTTHSARHRIEHLLGTSSRKPRRQQVPAKLTLWGRSRKERTHVELWGLQSL